MNWKPVVNNASQGSENSAYIFQYGDGLPLPVTGGFTPMAVNTTATCTVTKQYADVVKGDDTQTTEQSQYALYHVLHHEGKQISVESFVKSFEEQLENKDSFIMQCMIKCAQKGASSIVIPFPNREHAEACMRPLKAHGFICKIECQRLQKCLGKTISMGYGVFVPAHERAQTHTTKDCQCGTTRVHWAINNF